MDTSVKTKRPVYLNLFQFKFPITAIASILHRVSGVILFLVLPLFLWALQQSLNSAETFAQLHTWITKPWLKFIAWGILVALFYHLIAGVRHLLMDMHIGDSKSWGRHLSWLVIIISIGFAAFLGVCLW